MNKEQRGIIIGMILGDGCIQNNRLNLCHSIDQIEYLRYKANILESILGGSKNSIRETTSNNGYLCCRYGKSNTYIGILRKWIYKNDKKTISRRILDMLSLHGLAIWYMDDGCLSPKYRNGKIHAFDLTLNTYLDIDENKIIINYIKDTYGIEFKLSKGKGKYRLRIGTIEARKFIALIEPYIIPSMQYKIFIS